MPKISRRKKVINDISAAILDSKKDPFLVILEWDKKDLEHLTSQDVRGLMDVGGNK